MDDVQTFFRQQFINGNSLTIMHEGSSAFSVLYQEPDSVTTYFFANSDIRNHVLEICCATKLVKLVVPPGAQVFAVHPSTDSNQGVLFARKDHLKKTDCQNH